MTLNAPLSLDPSVETSFVLRNLEHASLLSPGLEPLNSLRLCMELLNQSSHRPAWRYRAPSLTAWSSMDFFVPVWRLRVHSILAWSRRVCLSRTGADRLSAAWNCRTPPVLARPDSVELPLSQPVHVEIEFIVRPSLQFPISLRPSLEPTSETLKRPKLQLQL